MNSMLSRLKAMQASQVRDVVANLDASSAPRGLRRRFEQIRNKKQGGFTLLELLVVVAILATIAATATIMLEDTDRKASAAAHVTIMDELVKGVATYRVLHQGQVPDVWDSFLTIAGTAAPADLTGAALLSESSDTNFGADGALVGGADGMLELVTLTENNMDALKAVGISQFQVLALGANDPNGANPGSCADAAAIKLMIEDKASDVTNSSIYSNYVAAAGPSGNRGGCAVTYEFPVTSTATDQLVRLKATENYRIGAGNNDVVVALGFGAANDLFQRGNLGSLTGAPFYRHVDGTTYNRFIALFNLGDATTPLTEARFMSVIDGSGDTKEEELAEWDNTRSTL